MRYRLRTLLIVLTVGCAFLGWVAFLRRAAEYHRREASRIADQIAESAFSHDRLVREAVEIYAAQSKVPDTDERFPKEAFVTHPDFGRQLVLSDGEIAEWDRAVRHQRMAMMYDGALLKPWTLLSSEPVQ